MTRLWYLRSLRRWWETRRCEHPDVGTQLIETGMRKMFWCRLCQRTWFS